MKTKLPPIDKSVITEWLKQGGHLERQMRELEDAIRADMQKRIDEELSNQIKKKDK